MSFVNAKNGRGFEAGYFLVDNEDCTRVTALIPQNHAQVVTLADGTKIVPAGAVFPTNDANATGIVYEDIDVTDGAMPGSVVTRGVIYGDLLPAALESAAVSALTGIKVVTAYPSIVRPLFDGAMTTLTVQSIAGTAAGDTKITVSGYTPGTGETYKYKVGDSAAAVAYGDDLSAWTTWNGSADITAATGKKIVVAVINGNNQAVAAGSATVTAKA